MPARKLNLSSLKKKTWKLFSEYVRRKDADENGMTRCFTCGSFKNFRELDGGHYHAGSTSLALFFDERNVKPQCTACNRFRHGNLTQFALGLEKLYGPNILEELDKDRHKITKYSRGDYEEMILKYKEKLKDLGTDSPIFGAR